MVGCGTLGRVTIGFADVRSQRLMAPAMIARRSPPGANASPVTALEAVKGRPTGSPLETLQNATAPFENAAASVEPSGEIAMALAEPAVSEIVRANFSGSSTERASADVIVASRGRARRRRSRRASPCRHAVGAAG